MVEYLERNVMISNAVSWPGPTCHVAVGHRRTTLALVCLAAAMVAGCAADRPLRTPDVTRTVQEQLATGSGAVPLAVPARVSEALAEPVPAPVATTSEPRIDLLINNAPVRDVLLALVADTRYSMLLHPDVTGNVSVTLRGVTMMEALESLRDVFGLDFRVDGRRITVQAPSLQTRLFTINYPTSRRDGSSELRVASGGATGGSGSNAASGAAAASGAPSPDAGQQENSRVSTRSSSNLWAELTDAVRAMVGSGKDRQVIATPQAGILVVRAMPEELRQVEQFLKAARLAIERQVMLEAKIVEVELRDGYQSGVNWAALATAGSTSLATGVLGSGVTSANPLLQSGVAVDGSVPIPAVQTGGGLFGLALQARGFAAVLGFLETQGDVQTLSSPRIATVNNQKAILKVGSDDYFVTNVSGGSTTAATAGTTASTTLPTLTLTPFFSGIALDVTPQVDGGNNIILHIHPSVTNVTERNKQIDLGSIGNYRLPLASSAVNESDTVVSVQDGSIVAIGGLMQIESNRQASGVPGSMNLPFFSALLGNRANTGRKKELVVLIKPTIIRSQEDWASQRRDVGAALDAIETVRRRVIKLDGTVVSK